MQLTVSAFRGLRFAGISLALCIAATLAGVYWQSFRQTERYITSRNFRLLTSLAAQTQSLADGQARILQGMMSGTDAGRKPAELIEAALEFVPNLRHLELSDLPASLPPALTQSRYRFETASGRTWLRLGLYTGADPNPVMRLRIDAPALLGAIYNPRLQQGAFDTLLLATDRGQVVFATGRRSPELGSADLGRLVRLGGAPAGSFRDRAGTSSTEDVIVSGVTYRMFLQPCCAATMHADGSSAPDGMVVVGLVEAGEIRSASLVVSPTIVVLFGGFVLLALVGYPFLKLLWLGERQQVSIFDVVQLGACSVGGLALATVVILSAWAASGLRRDLDRQLEGLAHEIDDRFDKELSASYEQLTCLEQRLRALQDKALITEVEREASCQHATFETFALISGDGYQAVKAGAARWVPGAIPVGRRAYFEAIARGQAWQGLASCRDGCFLESIWSWTTGEPQAVVSKPTGDKARPVAALSVPMRSLVHPVLPPGFEFAVITPAGDVAFHSDAQRNVSENLFQETDWNRRLRAMVAAHSSGALNARYWGRPYRAYVQPMDLPGWSIVTMADKRGVGGLQLEWTAVSVLFLGVYIIIWVMAIIVALKIGAAWLWPDPRRRTEYQALAVCYVVMSALFVLIVQRGDTRSLLMAGFAIPACAWLLTFGVLSQRPRGGQNAQEPLVEYATAGALLLLLSGAAPGAAFVLSSYDLHVESYVKHRQLGLARALSARQDVDGKDSFFAFFYGTRLQTRAAAEPAPHSAVHALHSHRDLLASTLEEYLPYYTESSVEMRELFHQRADDGSWSSAKSGHTLDVHVPRYLGGASLTLTSNLPALGRNSSQPADLDGEHIGRLTAAVWAGPVAALMLIGMAYGMVWFALRHVFLARVTPPLWASDRLAASAGDNVFVMCNRQAVAGQVGDTSPLALGPLAQGSDARARLAAALLEIDRHEPGRAVLVTDLDSDLKETRVTRRKLALIDDLVTDSARTVVVLAQTPVSTILDTVRRRSDSPSDRDRWQRIASAFIVVDWREEPVPAACSAGPEIPAGRTRARLAAYLPPLAALIEEEGRPSPYLRRICRDIQQSPAFKAGHLTRGQALEEIEERAAVAYRHLWNACSSEECVVLSHIARHGLTNAASRRIVRRLLVRGLLVKDPDLRLMNRTFRNFVLSAPCRERVGRLEGEADPSRWDRLRVPLIVGDGSVGAFLFGTQREMFDATVTIVTGTAAVLPAVFKAASLIAERRPRLPVEELKA
jgi:hypothetical protein